MSVSVVDAQGVKTALALRIPCPELAVAATLTPASFGAYVAPARIARLLIARDNDTASAQAAERLLARCRRRALDTAVIAAAGADFNDDLLAHGRDALGARIREAARAGPHRRARPLLEQSAGHAHCTPRTRATPPFDSAFIPIRTDVIYHGTPSSHSPAITPIEGSDRKMLSNRSPDRVERIRRRGGTIPAPAGVEGPSPMRARHNETMRR